MSPLFGAIQLVLTAICSEVGGGSGQQYVHRPALLSFVVVWLGVLDRCESAHQEKAECFTAGATGVLATSRVCLSHSVMIQVAADLDAEVGDLLLRIARLEGSDRSASKALVLFRFCWLGLLCRWPLSRLQA